MCASARATEAPKGYALSGLSSLRFTLLATILPMVFFITMPSSIKNKNPPSFATLSSLRPRSVVLFYKEIQYTNIKRPLGHAVE